MKHDSRAGVLVLRSLLKMPAYARNLVCVCLLLRVACMVHGLCNKRCIACAEWSIDMLSVWSFRSNSTDVHGV